MTGNNTLITIPVEFLCCHATYWIPLEYTAEHELAVSIAHTTEHPECKQDDHGRRPAEPVSDMDSHHAESDSRPYVRELRD